ncbi:MAG TPA: hypothetical protein VFG59_11355 [Anaeromyxobacter sp.]|nr:hypothetical protein [Anaeromyxobacter sp.]
MMAPVVLLTLALAAAGEVAAPSAPEQAPQAEAGVEESQPEAPERAEPPSPVPASHPDRAALRGYRQELGTGLHTTTFWSKSHHHYAIHSLSLGYQGSWGRRGYFLHATALLPLQGREDDRVVNLGAYYAQRWGGDVLTGYEARFGLGRRAELEVGGGPHVAFVVMKGISGYRDFNASPMGLGLDAVARWRTGGSLFRRPLDLGLLGSAAWDFWDPFHGKDLKRGFTFRLGVSVGIASRGTS